MVTVDSNGVVRIVDRRGWREVLSRSTYELNDPQGNRVTRRSLQQKDIDRVRGILGLR